MRPGARPDGPRPGLAGADGLATLKGEMFEVRHPGLLAAAIELDLERFRRAGILVRMPPAMGELAEALDRVATMLREADDLGQSVDLGDEVVRLIQRFRGVLCAVGGAPAQA